jgi:hypothetical protein
MTQKAVYFVAETRSIVLWVKKQHIQILNQPLFPPEELGDAGRVRLVSGTPGKPAYAGTDFIVARNDRIASIYLFSDSLA